MSLGLALMRALFVLLVVLANILPNRCFLRPAQIRVPWIQKSQVSPALPEAGMAGLREGRRPAKTQREKETRSGFFPKGSGRVDAAQSRPWLRAK